MNFWGGLALVVGLHVLVNAWAQPLVERRWHAAGARQRVAKAGTLAALQTAGDFLRVAALTFTGVAIVVLVLQWAAPAATLGVLSGMQSAALVTRDWAKAAGGTLGQILFWIGVAGAFVVIWALTLASYRETLAVEYLRQLRALVRRERAGELDPLPPTAEMLALAAEGAALGPAALPAERRRLAHRLRHCDLVRRIDLSKQTLPLGATGARGRMLRLLFSEGMVETGKNTTKRLGKIATAATAVLLLGGAAPGLRSAVIDPAIDTFAGLRIERELAASAGQLAALARARPAPPAPADPDYRAVAEEFLDALADDAGWAQVTARLADRALRPAAEARAIDEAFDAMLARDAVVRSYAADPASGTRAFALDDLPADDPGRRVLAEMRSRAGGPTALREAALDRLEAALRKAAATVPGFRARLKDSLAAFNRPARLGTFATLALGDQFALAIGTALPGPGGEAVFAAEGARAGRKGLQKSFEQVVQARFAGFLTDIAAGRPLGTALRRVQGDGLDRLLRRGEAARVAGLLDDADSRRDAFLARAFERRPVLAATVDRTEAKAAREMLAAPDWQSGVPLVAQFDDVLPGTAMALPTTLGLAAAEAGRPRAALVAQSAVLGPGAISRAPRVRPRGGGSLLGIVLTAASVAAALDAPAAVIDTAKVRGFTLTRSPTAQGYAAGGLAWRFTAGGMRLTARESGARLVPSGAVDPAVVRAALALAADGRPMALVAAPMGRLPVDRWLLHPVLEDTAAGGELIGLYRRAQASADVAALLGCRASCDGLAVVENARQLGIGKDTRDLLALTALFRAAFEGKVAIERQALVALAGELEPYRLARAATPRASLRETGLPPLR